MQELESALARQAGVEHAVCVASGFSALRLALGALGVGPDHRVLVPAYSCVALANAVLAWGATPVPVDVEAAGWNIDPAQCRRYFGDSRPRAVIAVNTFGVPARVEEIAGDAVPVIEDCAHAFRAEVDGKWLGSRASLAVTSFYATKLIGAGEGGAVLTNSPAMAAYVRRARDYGDQTADGHRMNDKMNDLEAALALAQLERLSSMIVAREAVAARYLKLLAIPALEQVFRLPSSVDPRIWYRFAVEMMNVPAERVVADLAGFGVHAAIPVSDWRPPDAGGGPTADRAYKSLVSLPLYPSLTEDEQDAVVEAFLQLGEGYSHG